MRSSDAPKPKAERKTRKRAPGAGRPPKPTALHKLEGTRPSKTRRDEPEPDLVHDLVVPGWLEELGDDGLAAEFFERVGRGLIRVGVLTALDTEALAAAAENYSVYRRASAQLPKRFAQRKGSPRPMVFTIRRQALEDLNKMLARFGMTPSDRAKVIAGDDVPLPPSIQGASDSSDRGRDWLSSFGAAAS